MPIRSLVNCASTTRVPRLPLCRRIDPWLTSALALVVAAVGWTAAPLATGALAPVSSDARIELTVPVATSVTPGWTSGDTDVRLPNLTIPGQSRDVTSPGWRMSTNWTNGYEVRIRSTTDPALRGSNSVDGNGARSSFADFTTGACPCPWTGRGFDRGVFGYSVSVASTSGGSVLDAAKWGTNGARKWRGFDRSSYRAYATAGGSGQYTMSIHLRSMIPDGATQLEGSYRAGLVVSAHPLA